MQLAAFSPFHTWPFLCASLVSLPLIRTQSHRVRDSPIRPHLTFVTSLKVPGGWGFNLWILEGTQFSLSITLTVNLASRSPLVLCLAATQMAWTLQANLHTHRTAGPAWHRCLSLDQRPAIKGVGPARSCPFSRILHDYLGEGHFLFSYAKLGFSQILNVRFSHIAVSGSGFVFKDFIYLVLEGKGGRQRERSISWLPLACARTGNQTCNPGFTLRNDAQATEPLQSRAGF